MRLGTSAGMRVSLWLHEIKASEEKAAALNHQKPIPKP